MATKNGGNKHLWRGNAPNKQAQPNNIQERGTSSRRKEKARRGVLGALEQRTRCPRQFKPFQRTTPAERCVERSDGEYEVLEGGELTNQEGPCTVENPEHRRIFLLCFLLLQNGALCGNQATARIYCWRCLASRKGGERANNCGSGCETGMQCLPKASIWCAPVPVN